MPERKDLEEVDGASKDDKDSVDLWQSHPHHKPVAQEHLLKRTDRRLPENARIRRWMDLGDKALQTDWEEEPTSE